MIVSLHKLLNIDVKRAVEIEIQVFERFARDVIERKIEIIDLLKSYETDEEKIYAAFVFSKLNALMYYNIDPADFEATALFLKTSFESFVSADEKVRAKILEKLKKTALESYYGKRYDPQDVV